MGNFGQPEGADAPLRTAIKRTLMHLAGREILPRRLVRAIITALRLEHL